jgi:hypothetical protein
LFAITGVVGTGLAARLGPFGAAASSTAPGDGGNETAALASAGLYLDTYILHTANRGHGVERQKGDHSLLRGTLLTPSGEKAGELFASAITMPGPVDIDSPHTPRMEIQNLQLSDGTILAMGTVFAQSDIPNVYTVVGGTGRYARLHGTYTFDDNPNVARPNGRAVITFDFGNAL